MIVAPRPVPLDKLGVTVGPIGYGIADYIVLILSCDLHVCVQLYNTVCLQMNGTVSKVNKKFISHLTRAQRTPSAAATVQVSHALPAVLFSCLLRGCGASFQDGAATGKRCLRAPF